jgi:NAD(P)-dependent dehydrogenase (short-subunit alcohol dehydrogenase family)
VAQQLAAQGVRVVLAGRDPQQGLQAAQTLGDPTKALFVQADVSSESQVQALVQQTLAHYGQLDLVFNNAGTEGMPGPLTGTTAESLEDILATNVKGTLLVLKHVLPPLLAQGSGTVINTASFIGTVVPFPEAMPYGATKAAVLSITRALAAGYAKDHLQFFAVCPWTTDSPMIDRLVQDKDDKAGAKASFGAGNPSGQLATPTDIAHVVMALFAGESNLPNGEAVLVDSGSVTSQIQPMSFQ